MNRLNVDRIDDKSSVVSSAINAPRQRRRFTAHEEGLSRASGTTSSSVYEDQMKIDRVFYNAFGDTMSLARSAEIDRTAHYNDDENDGIGLEETQNDAIIPFLMEFVQEQDEGLIEAVFNLDLSQEMPEPPKENNSVQAEQHDDVPVNAAAAEPDMDTSSIISIQRIVVPCLSDVRIGAPIQQRSLSYGRGNGEHSVQSIFKLKTPTHETVERMAPSPKTPTNTSLKTSSNPRSYSKSGNFTAMDIFQDTPFASSSCTTTVSSTSSSSTYQSFENSPDSTQESHFGHFQMNTTFTQTSRNDDYDTSRMDSTCFDFPFQSSMRSQSHNNLFDEPDIDGNWFAKEYSSQHDNNTPSTSFKMPSFSSPMSSQSQRQRPNLSNIKKLSQTSRSLANLHSASHSGKLFLFYFFSKFFLF